MIFFWGGRGGEGTVAQTQEMKGGSFTPHFFFWWGVMVKMKGPYDFFRWGKGAGAGGGLKYI